MSTAASFRTTSNSSGSRRSRCTIPARRRQLLRRGGFPNGFDAGFYNCDISYGNLAEAANNYSARSASGRSCGRWSVPRSTSNYARQEAEEHHPGRQRLVRQRGDPASRFVVKGGAYVYGSYPDIDALFRAAGGRTAIMPSARRSCTRCSRSCTRRRSSHGSGSSRSSMARDRGWANRASAAFPGFPYTAPYEEITQKSILAAREGRSMQRDVTSAPGRNRAFCNTPRASGARGAWPGRRATGRWLPLRRASSPMACTSRWRRPGSIPPRRRR